MTPTSLSRDVNPEESQRRQASVLGQHRIEGGVVSPSRGLRLGGIDELRGDLRTGSVKELAVGNGGTVHIVHVPDRKLRGSLRAGRAPNGNGGDGDDGIHRERLEGDGGNLVGGAGGVLDDDVAGGSRRSGGVGVAELEINSTSKFHG